MKLYSTITSDRAKKQQGGNKFIEINLFVARSRGSAEDSIKIAELSLKRLADGYHLYVSTIGTGDNNQCIDQVITDIELKADKR